MFEKYMVEANATRSVALELLKGNVAYCLIFIIDEAFEPVAAIGSFKLLGAVTYS